jgi:hypothetical protein
MFISLFLASNSVAANLGSRIPLAQNIHLVSVRDLGFGSIIASSRERDGRDTISIIPDPDAPPVQHIGCPTIPLIGCFCAEHRQANSSKSQIEAMPDDHLAPLSAAEHY